MLDDTRAKSKVPIPFLCLNDLFEYQARIRPDAAALLAPGREPLSYRDLHRHIGEIGRALRIMGIGREDRVAIMLPNGPELALAIFSVASNAACAVVNPAYAADELERYFDVLHLKALIIPAGADSPAHQAARARGIGIIELSVAPDAKAGLFALHRGYSGGASLDPVGPGSIALFILTSGTTARPKIVALTHVNICSSAYSSVACCALTDSDRCLNVLPLFHCHGLVDTVLAPLAAGAGVVCAPGCDVNSFFGWLRGLRVKWYSAVPTMHQAILGQARLHPEQVENLQLRFVRSASGPLPPRVFVELEQALATTVVEFYGMTETAGAPIASNPLPPARRKAGSTGKPVALDVAIMGDGGDFLPDGKTGQVVIRGPCVTLGYDGDPEATAAAFDGDWLKTGDIGFFDDEGYLFLVGRSREMINRGGEKLTPREIDEVLLEHPAVAEAITFAVPHPSLGEDVAAAIVLRPGAKTTTNKIRQFAMSRLAEFKVPRQVLFLKELPKSATGKVRRVGLAAKLGLASGTVTAFVAPRTPLENVLSGIWADVLRREKIGIHDDFFALGGDSLLAAQAMTCIYETMQLKVEVAGLFDAPTVAEMAEHLEKLIQAGNAKQPALSIPRASQQGSPPASPAQERLWNLHRALPDLPFFNILYVLRVTSPVDSVILERALNEIVQRHEILRTTFAVAGTRLVQIIAQRLAIPLNVADFRKHSKTRKEQASSHAIKRELLHCFDLERGPLIRVHLLQLNAEESLLLLCVHQSLVDGRSVGLLAEELAAVYGAFAAARPSPLSPLPLQFTDFSTWQRQWHADPDMVRQLGYWREQLAGPLPVSTLAKDRRARATDDLRTAERDLALPARLTNAVKAFSHREGGTLFMALVAGLMTVMRRNSATDDLRVATNVANRNRPGSEGLIGPLVNTVILRTRLDGSETPREVLHRVRATTLAAYAHQDLPFEDLAETLAREQRIDAAGLAQVMILLHNATLRPEASSGDCLVYEEADPDIHMPLVTTTTYDVILTLRESARGLVGSCIYRPQLFTAKSIDRLLGDFRQALENMVVRPERSISAI